MASTDGATADASVDSTARAGRAIRESVALTRLDHVTPLRLRGEDARDALDLLCAGTLRARDGQLQHVLLLDDDGRCFADAYLVCDDDEYDLLVEGPSPEALDAHLARHLPDDLDVEIERRATTHAILGLDGPFAWEVVSRVAGAEAVGLPYLTFFHAPEWTCYRAGKTGEFGYGLIVPREQLEALEATLAAHGERLDMARGTLDALDQCARENFFFNVRREGREPVGPAELQLQWRVAYDKDAVGVAAARTRRDAGVTQRLTCLVSDGAMARGDVVSLEGARVGRIVSAGWSPVRDDGVALALLDLRVAWPGIDGFVVAGAHEVRARSMTPPLLNNRSLFVSPQLHSYATRDEIAMPPLVRA